MHSQLCSYIKGVRPSTNRRPSRILLRRVTSEIVEVQRYYISSMKFLLQMVRTCISLIRTYLVRFSVIQ